MAKMAEVKVTRRQPTADVALIATDPDALERFYRAHVDAVERFVARRVDDPSLAADLTADVFVAAIESAASYAPGRGEPVAWLFGIARNVVSGEHRRNARELRMAARVRGRELLDEDDVAALAERIDAESGARAVHRELSALAPSERAVLELVALDGLSAGEAARALGIGPVAARVRLHRARRALRERLAVPTLTDVPEVSP
jgi:RNA polymerase sigma-70 factor (ECF subfamily)